MVRLGCQFLTPSLGPPLLLSLVLDPSNLTTTALEAGLRGGPTGQLPWAPICKGRYDVTGIIENMMLVNSGDHMRNNFSENYLKFTHAP